MNPDLQNNLPLRDIHLPEAVFWWPPALGWWLLAGLVILAILLLPKLYRYIKLKPLNKVSTVAYQHIIDDYQRHQNKLLLVQSLSKLLRQISMSYQGREATANLTGDAWVNKLNSLTEKDYFSSDVRQLLIQAPYQKNIKTDPQLLISATCHWIAALPKNNIGAAR